MNIQCYIPMVHVVIDIYTKDWKKEQNVKYSNIWKVGLSVVFALLLCTILCFQNFVLCIS